MFEIIIAIKHIDNMYPSKIDTNHIFMFKILLVQGYDQIFGKLNWFDHGEIKNNNQRYS